MHSSLESSSSSQAVTPILLTPDSDSDSDSDNDYNGDHDGQQQSSFKLVSRAEKAVVSIEKGDTALAAAKFFDEEAVELESRFRDADADADLNEEDSSQMLARRYDGRFGIETTRSYELYTPDEERAVIRKFDRRLVLFVAFLYMLSFLDRSNIGNARIAGLAGDLKLTSNQYEWLLTSFYLSYITFEWMSILFQKIPAHIYITLLVLSWGLCASLQSIISTFPALLILRILLGIGEAGFTGIPFYLSFFYKREELAFRTGLFVSAAPLATSFASSLGYGILLLSQYVPIVAWRLLFLLEGFPSVIVSLIAWYQIPDRPDSAPYLSKRQKKIAKLRLRKEKKSLITKNSGGSNSNSNSKLQELLSTIRDPKIWITAIMFFCTNMAFASLPAYLPKILSEMKHYSPQTSQALSAPPYLLSFLLVILTAYLSDLTHNRSYFIIFHALLSATGYFLLTLSGILHWNNWIRYAAIYPAAVGFFSVITVVITWNLNNSNGGGGESNGMGFAMLQLIGQCGPLLGTRLYPDSDAPLYTRGMAVCCGAMVLVAVLAVGLRFYLMRENARQDVYDVVDDVDDEGLVAKGGDGSRRRFRYLL